MHDDEDPLVFDIDEDDVLPEVDEDCDSGVEEIEETEDVPPPLPRPESDDDESDCSSWGSCDNAKKKYRELKKKMRVVRAFSGSSLEFEFDDHIA